MAFLHHAAQPKDSLSLLDRRITIPRDRRTSGSSLSSTPHAPRVRRELPFVPTHPLHQQYRYLDAKKLKSPSTTDLQLRTGDAKASPNKHSGRETVDSPGTRSQQTTPVKVRPFRRTFTQSPPKGIPLLDLSRFNEPDEQMAMVEIIPDGQELIGTARSDLSWGTTRLPPDLSARRRLQQNTAFKREDEAGQEGSGDSEEGKRPTVDNGEKLDDLAMLLPSQLEFVENRVLSHERSFAHLGGRPETVLEQKQKDQEIPTTTALVQLALKDPHLARRLRFGARILTQHGRDVHRELCGFFFLVDDSLTIYEFRQFGQRSSALPLVPRAIYRHPVGTKRKDKVYDIRSIRKGTTLYFDTSTLQSLPASLGRRPLLAIRITDVDEHAKWNLVKEGLKPTEYGRMRDYLDFPPSEESQRDASLLQTLQGMIRSRLKGRSSKTLVGLGRMLYRLSAIGGERGAGVTVSVNRLHLQQALRAFHISLTPEDFGQLWDLLMDREMCHHDDRQDKGLWVEWSIAGLIGDISEDRIAIIRKVYKKLDPAKSGNIQWNQLSRYFCPWRHPDVVAGKRTTDEISFILFGCLQDLDQRKQETVNYAELEHFYMGVSLEMPLDSDFYALMRSCWSL